MASQEKNNTQETANQNQPDDNRNSNSPRIQQPVQRTAPEKREKENVIFKWKAPARPFKPRDRQFWTTTIVLAFIFGALLYIIEGLMPVFVLIAFMFLYYVLTTVKPDEIEYQITNYGVRFADKLKEWPSLIRFWFLQRGESHLLVIDTVDLPGRIELVINSNDKKQLRDAMNDYLPEEESSPSGMERAANWLSQKIPEKKNSS